MNISQFFFNWNHFEICWISSNSLRMIRSDNYVDVKFCGVNPGADFSQYRQNRNYFFNCDQSQESNHLPSNFDCGSPVQFSTLGITMPTLKSLKCVDFFIDFVLWDNFSVKPTVKVITQTLGIRYDRICFILKFENLKNEFPVYIFSKSQFLSQFSVLEALLELLWCQLWPKITLKTPKVIIENILTN